MKRQIIIQKETTVNAIGNTHSRHTKPVICLTTGETYTSCFDAAKANGVHFSAMSNCCTGKQRTANGKRYCYVADLPDHLEELSMTLQKCSGYLAEMAEKERREREEEEYRQKALKAEEKRQRELAKAEEKIAKKEEKLNRLTERFEELYKEIAEMEREVASEREELQDLTNASILVQLSKTQIEMAI